MAKFAATATAAPVDLETGESRDQIAATGSSSFTPDTPSKAATPRRSFEFEDRQPTQRSFVTKTWRKAEERLPAPVTRWSRKAVAWIKGPEPPVLHRINPLFEPIQTYPTRLIARLPKQLRICLFAAAFILWVVLFGVIISDFSLPTNLAGYGAPVRLGCATQLWPNAQSCGIDGRNCLPFDDSAFAFNCPADCAGTQVLNPRAIGNQSIVYRPLVVGGTQDTATDNALVYRGDSFICGAAIHAGIISNGRGGCGVVSLAGERDSYGSISRNGISSVGFDSSFPLSFEFNQTAQVVSASKKCRDPRWDLLVLSTMFTAQFALFTSKPATFFAPIFVIIFFQIAMASDPPSYSNYPSLASTTLGRFLPAASVAALIYRFSVRKTLLNCKAHVEKPILWVGGCWVGALGNYTFERIPIQRLTSHDLHQQPGAITALIIIVLVLFAVVLYQAWCFRTEGRLPRMLGLYAILGVGLLICYGIPQLSLRIHHYVLALLLLPGTSMQTRVSLLCQGILVGLFINGIARWGFDPILQTTAALRGDAQLGSGIPSVVAAVSGSNITFTWDSILRGYEGVSVIVNDVERYRGVHPGSDGKFTWTRQATESPEYFRFGFTNYLPFGSISYSDFTNAGIWWLNGTWSDPAPGRTLY
ncbi:hypothetical protein BU25DRAFT_408122 [Macroventuria anomochaeta]|uniref:Uncharacterized protein n=1 Tax=Macroventuria anomochaeta TaxID=301207 RepID=A0ACB6SC74_9PLEO|nr:uncharacterized protein BU25DRAFT_408122 [Macroventuria anomochaeta]KAF2630849.1 hypothetical protein BU25DRAFT_408122 [Macroventuria anomochaeta]